MSAIPEGPDEEVYNPSAAWENGYSVGELWGFTKPVARGDGALENTHLIMWGILSIVEYQVNRGAGHKYLRDRLWNGDWKAVGYVAPKGAESQLVILPPIKDAQFGHKPSAIGDGVTRYIDVRVVHSNFFANSIQEDTSSKSA